MGVEVNVRDSRLKAKMDASTYKPDRFAKELEDELMKYTQKPSEGNKVNSQSVEEVQRDSADVEVNISECTKPLVNEPVLAECKDTTESSSSFGGSDCGLDNSDTEVSSDFHASEIGFDGFGENIRMRKKKLTTHWRSYIQPLMWRCKWIELQINKLKAQGKKYEKELEAYNNGKQIRLDNSEPIDSAKSLPFSPRVSARDEFFKRKKRKRNEATVDVAAYMSRHNIFSYYENKKSLTDGPTVVNDLNNSATQTVNFDDDFWVNDELLQSFEPREGENSLEHVLSKIEFLQSKVVNLKSTAEKIMRENAGKFSSSDDLSFAMAYSTSSGYSGDATGVGNYFASQLLSEYITVPESKVTTRGGEDGVLIDNRRVKEETNNLDDVMIHPIERPLVINTAPTPVRAEAELPVKNESPPKMRSIAKIATPKGKRKRGKRRGGGRPGRRSTG
ncbi:hypothetical protein ABFS83_02G142100 [Erythranthe nasuta]